MARLRVCCVAAAALCALCAASAQARIPTAGLRAGVTARQEIAPLLRKSSGGAVGGFDFLPTFETRAHGYKAAVVSFGGTVAVLVSRGKGNIAAYLARGVATSRRLEASFGAFGHLDMRFRPGPETPLPPRRGRCRGSLRYPERDGTWVGRFRFVGEAGYVSFDVRRARGSVRRNHPSCSKAPLRHPRRTTSSFSGPFASFALREAIGAGWHRGLESVDVEGLKSTDRTVYLATTSRTIGSVGVLRLALGKAGPQTLSVDNALTRAEMSPPPPFHGTGTYTAAPDGSTTWLGDLSVNFLGAPAVPLAGEQFQVEVERPL